MRLPTHNELIAAYLPLARSLSYKWARQLNITHYRDDLEADGFEALCRAAPLYDPSLPATFGTFAYPRVRRAIINAAFVYRSPVRIHGNVTARFEAVPLEDWTPSASEEGDGEAAAEVGMSLRSISRALTAVSPRDADLFLDSVMNGSTGKVLAGKFGVCRATTIKIVREVTAVVREQVAA